MDRRDSWEQTAKQQTLTVSIAVFHVQAEITVSVAVFHVQAANTDYVCSCVSLAGSKHCFCSCVSPQQTITVSVAVFYLKPLTVSIAVFHVQAAITDCVCSCVSRAGSNH